MLRRCEEFKQWREDTVALMGDTPVRRRGALPWKHSCLQRRRPSLHVVLILLVLCLTIQVIYIHPSRVFFKLFGPDWTPSEKPFQTNDHPKEPHPLHEGLLRLLLKQNASHRQQDGLTERLPPDQRLPLKDGVSTMESQNQGPSSNGSVNQNLQRTCQPKTHIVFLKTHKTASSTVQNIMFRYGDSRALVFALPKKWDNRLSYPDVFQQHFVERKHLTHFDILCSHMRFRRAEVMKVMPEDSFYFSILRHPVALMESGFEYFYTDTVFRGFRSIDDFLDNGQNRRSVNDYLAHNNLAFDFGYDHTATANTSGLDTIVGNVIAGIERDFHLILISEYFDESMILLKHALCWSLEDVVSFKLNSRSDQSRKTISPMTVEKIRRWNVVDWGIYHHFNATFWDKVRGVVGEEQMKREVSELRERQANLTSSCLKGGRAINPREIKDRHLKPFQPGGAVIQGYALNPGLDTPTRDKCHKLIMPELHYTRLLYNKQFSEAASALGAAGKV